ncbi:MAG: hypothetical protein ACXQS2_06150 [Methermicoccaceae archaeon]
MFSVAGTAQSTEIGEVPDINMPGVYGGSVVEAVAVEGSISISSKTGIIINPDPTIEELTNALLPQNNMVVMYHYSYLTMEFIVDSPNLSGLFFVLNVSKTTLDEPETFEVYISSTPEKPDARIGSVVGTNMNSYALPLWGTGVTPSKININDTGYSTYAGNVAANNSTERYSIYIWVIGVGEGASRVDWALIMDKEALAIITHSENVDKSGRQYIWIAGEAQTPLILVPGLLLSMGGAYIFERRKKRMLLAGSIGFLLPLLVHFIGLEPYILAYPAGSFAGFLSSCTLYGAITGYIYSKGQRQ